MRTVSGDAPGARAHLARAGWILACALGALAGCNGNDLPRPAETVSPAPPPATAPAPADGFWLEGDGERAKALIAALRAAADDGLDPQHYGVQSLARALEDAGDAAAREAALDAAFLRYAADLRHGRVRAEGAEPPRYLPRPPPEAAALRALIEDWDGQGDLAAVLRPPGQAYAWAQAALVRYRRIAAAGGWPQPPPAPTLHPADPAAPAAALAALRARLAVEDARLRAADPDPAGARTVLVEALRDFQVRHGLTPDGVVGLRTRAALAVPAQARVAQLALALERLRWPDAAPLADGVEVNVPDATLVLYQGGRPALASRVIVGQPSWATPIFATPITAVLFHPPWNVPSSITRTELIAKVRRDPGYLAREGIEVVSGYGPDARVLDPGVVDWSAPGAIRLRQRPGPGNALGQLKFQMPNRYAVFLHDTPERTLFARDARALSHGCVRVERARELAALLLPGGPAQVDAALRAGVTREVRLPRPLPVRIVYRTAWADAAGAAHFRTDVYGYDRALAQALRLPAHGQSLNNAATSSPRPRGDHG